jgi:phenylalanyl-tRNA synthetase beta chain
MKLPLSWLREFVEVEVSPERLGADLTAVGLALEGIETHGSETVLDLDVTTNRVDAMNVYGIAREVSVIYSRPLRPPDLSLAEKGPPASAVLDVTIEAADLCPRFCGRVLDVRMGPSPAWLRNRLEMMGVRPISNVVDLTNYVMLELGQPSHVFDLARVPEGRLSVRWGRQGERLRTLDGVDRTIVSWVGVVAGLEGPLALAGIMGGASSEVKDETRIVALEAAYWEPLAIRRGAKALGMHTEASHRFERGSDPECPPVATARLAHLLQKIEAGSARPGLIDRIAAPRPRRSTYLRPARLRGVLGIDVPRARTEAILKGLGFDLTRVEGDNLQLVIPTWRADVSREDDVVEEVARHHGLDKIPSSLPPARAVGELGAGMSATRTLRQVLVGAGLTEVIGYAFEADGGREAVALQNPLAEDQSVLRTSLLPGLLRVQEANLRQGRRDVALFEIGRVFPPADGRPEESLRLGLLLHGAARPRHWSEKPRAADLFDVKGILESAFERLGLGRLEFTSPNDAPELLHPGQRAALVLGGRTIGHAGALRPGTREDAEGTFLAELGLAELRETAPPERFSALPRFPAVERDLSVMVPASMLAVEIEGRVKRAAGRALAEVAVTDRYDKPPVPAGMVSLLLSLRYEDRTRTLTGEEVQASLDNIIRELRGAGFSIRSE